MQKGSDDIMKVTGSIKEAHGKEVIESLAEVYQQLYIKPADDAGEKYASIVRRGLEAEEKDLSHFKTHKDDSLVFVDTPEGKVCVVTLKERQDFETIIRIMANRCAPVEVPSSQGASILSGVINWRKIEAHEEEFLKQEKEKGVEDPDWNAEFKRFTSDKKNYLDVLIILSFGPYSGMDGEVFGMEDQEWAEYSNTIRLYHECTHFICRKRYPEKIDAVWDELVADAIGIYAAFGKYDRKMEERFLGIENERYLGGRLENYVKDLSGEEKLNELSRLSGIITGILKRFDEMIQGVSDAEPFDLIDILESSMDSLWISDNSSKRDK